MALKIFYEAFGRELSDTEVNNAGYKEYCARKAIGKAFGRTIANPLTCKAECPPLLQTVRVDGREVSASVMSNSASG